MTAKKVSFTFAAKWTCVTKITKLVLLFSTAASAKSIHCSKNSLQPQQRKILLEPIVTAKPFRSPLYRFTDCQHANSFSLLFIAYEQVCKRLQILLLPKQQKTPNAVYKVPVLQAEINYSEVYASDCSEFIINKPLFFV